MKRHSQTTVSIRKNSSRRAVAAVEFALVAPLLVLVVLGTIDVGQYVNVGQVVNNASREGGRYACRNDVTTVSEVTTKVQNYMASAFPSVSSGDLNAALTVTVRDENNAVIPAGDLTTIPSGSGVSVQVTLQFEPVRWLGGFVNLSGTSCTTTTLMRRE
jgi:Flp pilus assembly protein TadG